MFTQQEIADHLGVSRKTVNKNRQMFEGCATLEDCRRAYSEKANHAKINNKKEVSAEPKTKPRVTQLPKSVLKMREKAIEEQVSREILSGNGKYIHENINDILLKLLDRLVAVGDEIDISEANDIKIKAAAVSTAQSSFIKSGRLIDKASVEDDMKILFKYFGKLLWDMPKKIAPLLVGLDLVEIEKMILSEHEAMVKDVKANWDRLVEEHHSGRP